MEEQKESRPRSRWSIPRIVIFCLLLAVFCVSGGVLVTEIVRERREARAFEDLLDQLEERQYAEDWPSQQLPSQPAQTDGKIPGEPESEPEPFNRYIALYEQNPDLFGWVTIEGTVINYPVMYTPEDPEYYLHRAFDGSDSKSGVPFLDGACYEGCGNYLIYGHDMKNGSMFAGLLKYAKKEYWEEHPVIIFDTVSAPGEYEVLAAFYERVHTTNETDVFRYYNYTDLTDPEVFEEYMTYVRAAARYDTGVEAEYGDQLISLSTCSYQTANGRFVVVARKIRPQE